MMMYPLNSVREEIFGGFAFAESLSGFEIGQSLFEWHSG